MRQDNREKLRRDTRMRTDAARGVYPNKEGMVNLVDIVLFAAFFRADDRVPLRSVLPSMENRAVVD